MLVFSDFDLKLPELKLFLVPFELSRGPHPLPFCRFLCWSCHCHASSWDPGAVHWLVICFLRIW